MPYAHVFASQVDADLWILERRPRELSLRWVQSGRCHYGEHRWVLVNARRAGICAVSGERIKVGDRIYRPSSNVALIAAGVQIHERALDKSLEMSSDVPVSPEWTLSVC